MSLNFFPILLILVAGYVTRKAIPSLRRSILKPNGQQLTLASAVTGLAVFLPLYVAFNFFTEKEYIIFQDGSEYINIALPLSIATLGISFLLWLADFLLIWCYEYLLDDRRLKKWVSNKSKEKLSHEKYKILCRAIQMLHWVSYLYAVYASRAMIGNDHAENLYLNSILERKSGLCMFVMDSKKVVIGNISAMPDPSSPKTESYIRVFPYFTGHLCEAHLQLHITTDYTYHIEEQIKGIAHQSYNFDVVLPSSKVSYVREFDRAYFRSNFVDKQCPCGYKIYNTNTIKKKKSADNFNGFRNQINKN